MPPLSNALALFSLVAAMRWSTSFSSKIIRGTQGTVISTPRPHGDAEHVQYLAIPDGLVAHVRKNVSFSTLHTGTKHGRHLAVPDEPAVDVGQQLSVLNSPRYQLVRGGSTPEKKDVRQEEVRGHIIERIRCGAHVHTSLCTVVVLTVYTTPYVSQRTPVLVVGGLHVHEHLHFLSFYQTTNGIHTGRCLRAVV